MALYLHIEFYFLRPNDDVPGFFWITFPEIALGEGLKNSPIRVKDFVERFSRFPSSDF